MRKIFNSLLAAGFLGLVNAQALAAADAETNSPEKETAISELAGCEQLLLVTTKDWDSPTGTLRRFLRIDSRATPRGRWAVARIPPHGPRGQGISIEVVVGRNGLGWGRGLVLPDTLPGPTKKEGDGKSPAGVFRLSSAFGLAAAEKMKDIKLPYRQLTDEIECVDDVKSTNYNSIVNRAEKSPADWSSSEKMRAVGERYRLGIVVDHNVDPREAGGGSCIFIHIWQDAATGTSGCTAMAPENMEEIIRWLNPERHPLLVQMPEAAYQELRGKLGLP